MFDFLKRKTPVGPATEEFCAVMHRRSSGRPKAANTDANRLRAAVALLDVACVEAITTRCVAAALTKKEIEGSSPKTVNCYREILHRFCSHLIREKGVRFRETGSNNPVALTQRRRESAPQITFLEPAQQDALLNGVSLNPELRAIIAMLIFAGPRRGELIWLTKADVDLAQGLVHIRAKDVDGVHWQPKTGVNRSVPISTRLRAELSTYTSPAGPPWFFPSPTGRRYDEDNLSKTIAAAQKPLGTSWSSLDFRHTFGTMLARHGVSDFQIAVLMGNSPPIVRRHYANLRAQDLADKVDW